MTPLYLVTEHDTYYPADGVADWVLLSDRYAPAKERYDSLAPGHYKHKFLIKLTGNEWRVLEEA